jgi:threonine dehydrogenase-like Zn-dependent dehydrogenase
MRVNVMSRREFMASAVIGCGVAGVLAGSATKLLGFRDVCNG